MTTYEEPLLTVSNALLEDQSSAVSPTYGSIDNSGDNFSGSEFSYYQTATSTPSSKFQNGTTSTRSTELSPKPQVTKQFSIILGEGSSVGKNYKVLSTFSNETASKRDVSTIVPTFGFISDSEDDAIGSTDVARTETNALTVPDVTSDASTSILPYNTTAEKTTIFSPLTNKYIVPLKNASSVPDGNDFSSTTVFPPSTSEIPRHNIDTKTTTSTTETEVSGSFSFTDSYSSPIIATEDSITLFPITDRNKVPVASTASTLNSFFNTTSPPIKASTDVFVTFAKVESATTEIVDRMSPSIRTKTITFPLETMQSSFKRTTPIGDEKSSTANATGSLTQTLHPSKVSTGIITPNPIHVMTPPSQPVSNTPMDEILKLITTSYLDEQEITFSHEQEISTENVLTPISKSVPIPNSVATSEHHSNINTASSLTSFEAISNLPEYNDGERFTKTLIPTPRASGDDATMMSSDATLMTSAFLTTSKKAAGSKEPELFSTGYEASAQPVTSVSSISERQRTVSSRFNEKTTATEGIVDITTTFTRSALLEPSSRPFSKTENNPTVSSTLISRITNASVAVETSSKDVHASSGGSIQYTEQMPASASMKTTETSLPSTARMTQSESKPPDFTTSKNIYNQTTDVISNTLQSLSESLSSSSIAVSPFNASTSNESHEVSTPNQRTSNFTESFSTSSSSTLSRATMKTVPSINKPSLSNSTADSYVESTFFSKTKSLPTKLVTSLTSSVAYETSTLNYSAAVTTPSASTNLFEASLSVSNSTFHTGSTDKFHKTEATTNSSGNSEAVTFSTEKGTILVHSTERAVNFSTGASVTYSVPLLVIAGFVVLLIFILALTLLIVACSNEGKSKSKINQAGESSTNRDRIEMPVYAGSSWNNFSEDAGSSVIIGPKLKLHAANNPNFSNSPNKSRILGKLDRLWSSSSGLSTDASISTSRNASCAGDIV